MRLTILILTVGWIAMIACSGDSNDTNKTKVSTEEQAKLDSLATVEADENLIRMASASLIGTYMGEMQSRLGTAMKTSSVAKAIGVCRISAPEVADSMSLEGWTIRRVSEKNRNQDNRATLAEKNILAVFTDTVQPKRKFIGNWQTQDSVTSYNYYKPIFTKRICLKCHGDMQTLASGVYKQVKKHYPTDKATGYKEGELRGMFVVEVDWPEGREFAEALVSGHAFEPVETDTTAVDSNQADETPSTN